LAAVLPGSIERAAVGCLRSRYRRRGKARNQLFHVEPIHRVLVHSRLQSGARTDAPIVAEIRPAVVPGSAACARPIGCSGPRRLVNLDRGQWRR
jgi:hypothetical protein